MQDAGTPSMSTIEPPASEPRWHVIVGVISLIYAALGILVDVFFIGGGLLGPIIMARFTGKEMPPAPNLGWFYFSEVISLALGFFLLTGGLRMIRRLPTCLTPLRVWVIGRLIMTLLGLVVGFVTLPSQLAYQKQVDAAMRDLVESQQAGASSSMPPFDEARSATMMRATIVGVSIVSVAYPLFLGLLVTNRRKLEQIEAWRSIIR